MFLYRDYVFQSSTTPSILSLSLHQSTYHIKDPFSSSTRPVGSGKTALMYELCSALRNTHSIAAVTNDIFTKEDGEFLTRNEALPPERIAAVETGGCPHAAIREDASMNLDAIDDLEAAHAGLELLFVESGGDNLAASFSPELVDTSISVIDV